MKFVKAVLIDIYFFFKNVYDSCFGWIQTKKLWKKSGPKAYLVGTPQHDNLGDHAIAMSEYQFISKHFPDYKIIEIPVEDWRKYRISLSRNATTTDLFFMTGGGNMGDIYLPDEKLRRYIIRKYKKNKIIVFPQTMHFTDTRRGTKELNKSRDIYNKHPSLLLCAREAVSFELLKRSFSCKICLFPDMVFNLEMEFDKNDIKRGVGVCLRCDEEKKLDKTVEAFFLANIAKNYEIEHFSTCMTSGVSIEEREDCLKLLWQRISKYELIITDRLHAMIFASLIGVKCLSIASFNHKITGTLEWMLIDDENEWKRQLDEYNVDASLVVGLKVDKNCYHTLAKLIIEEL